MRSPPRRFRIRWRTLGQRRSRAQKAQVSAVAVVLGLLLFTTMLSNWVLTPLSSEMTQNEFSHELKVVDQLEQLQSDVLAQLTAGTSTPTELVAPISLGSAAEPPFAPASTSTLTPEVLGDSSTVGYQLERFVPNPPNWAAGLSCSPTGSPCHGGWDNVTGTPFSSYTFKLNGGNPTFLLNFTGNNDSISIDWLGHSITTAIFIFNGSFLHVTFSKSSNGGATDTPHVLILFYGQNDVLEVPSMNEHNLGMNVTYVDTLGAPCPFANGSRTDRFYLNDTSATNALINVTWLNSVGYESGPTRIAFGSGSVVSYQNRTGVPSGCAWDTAYASHYTSPFWSGVRVHLNNRYLPSADVVYDQGAVILSHPGLGSIMLSGPRVSFLATSTGYIANLTLVNALTNFNGVEGTFTAAVQSQLLNVQSFLVQPNPTAGTYLGGVWLNLTTPYPFAWESFFRTFPPGSLLDLSCQLPASAPAGSNCYIPPAGVSVQLSALLYLKALQLYVVTAGLTAY
jgi:hypothetical protein